MPLRVLFLGTPEFAVPSLKAIHQSSEFNIVGVITQPEKRTGRGLKPSPSAIKKEAQKLSLPIYEFPKIKHEEALKTLVGLRPDLVVVVAYGQLLPKKLLEFPPLRCINAHASLLPKYRGAAPIQWALMNNEKETGVTTMLMDEGMDDGNILLQERINIESLDDAGILHNKLSFIAASLLIKTLIAWKTKEIVPQSQDPKEATYAPKITKKMCIIDWKKSALEIEGLVKALSPFPGARTLLQGKVLKIFKTLVVAESVTLSPGSIISTAEGSIKVTTGKGILLLKELQLESKKRLPTAEFLKGFTVKPGERLQ